MFHLVKGIVEYVQKLLICDDFVGDFKKKLKGKTRQEKREKNREESE